MSLALLVVGTEQGCSLHPPQSNFRDHMARKEVECQQVSDQLSTTASRLKNKEMELREVQVSGSTAGECAHCSALVAVAASYKVLVFPGIRHW